VPGTLRFTTISVGNAVACSRDRADQSCETSDTYHACGLGVGGEAYCWGSNQFGQLGDGGTSESATPVRVTGGRSFAAISAGDAFTCAVSTAHDLFCWGRNASGELGVGSVDQGQHPVPQPAAGGVTAVSASADYACALRTDGTAFCWGNGGLDRLGSGQAVGYGPNPSPVQVETDQKFVSISAGRTHVCALTTGGTAYCWGGTPYLEAGPGDRRPHPIPGQTFASVVAGTAYHSCGVTSGGAAYCWGANPRGQLGAGMSAPETCGLESWACSSVPVAVAGGLRFKSIGAGVEFTCGVTISGEAYCWGNNSRGLLGTGDRNERAVPAKVGNP
jgi:alpha-tubulin suppressor-like RCC1 family protein